MKSGIHPEYSETTIQCACGNVIEVGSTKSNIRVEICSKCHPFYRQTKTDRFRWTNRTFQKKICEVFGSAEIT